MRVSMESTRCRNSSGRHEDMDEKEFLSRLIRNRDSSQYDHVKLKIKIRPLRQGLQGIQIFVIRDDDAAFYYSVDITDDDYR